MDAFPETADIESSTDEYARRFEGPTGRWMLKVQERITRSLIAPYEIGCSVLDVGGGHGQLAIPLSKAGYKVTVVGSAMECSHRIQHDVEARNIRFQVGNMIDLPFMDRSFDVVLCFRMLTHCERWPKLVFELTRVARRVVIVEYPTSQSINRFAPWLFEAKKKVERNTRLWRLFTHEEIRTIFDRYGYRRACMQKQFFFPMVVHRMIDFLPVSTGLESIAHHTGLIRVAGSPVIAAFEGRSFK